MATDNTQPIPSQLEPFVDRFRRVTPSWWPWMRALLAQLKTTVAEVESVSTVVDNVKQQWGVEITEDGRVRAAVKLDGSETTSKFGVLADQFVVVSPSSPLVETQAFVDGVINGVPGVGINGATFIIDGSIFARHLSVTTLSAVSATLGDVTTGSITSPDGRLSIIANAETQRIRLTS